MTFKLSILLLVDNNNKKLSSLTHFNNLKQIKALQPSLKLTQFLSVWNSSILLEIETRMAREKSCKPLRQTALDWTYGLGIIQLWEIHIPSLATCIATIARTWVLSCLLIVAPEPPLRTGVVFQTWRLSSSFTREKWILNEQRLVSIYRYEQYPMMWSRLVGLPHHCSCRMNHHGFP